MNKSRRESGGKRGAIARATLGTAGVWVGGGLAAGLGAGLIARNAIRSLSNAAAAGSSWVYAAAALLFLVLMLVAACLPMRRASRIDPASVLRFE